MIKARFSTLSIMLACLLSAGINSNLLLPRTRAAVQPAPDVLASSAADADPRDETSIAVSPKNDQIIVGASKVIVGGATGNGVSRIGYYFSSDGGHSWGNGILGLDTPQKTWNRASDPSVAVDLNGNFYICALVLDESTGSIDSGVYIYQSSDGGRTFGVPFPVIFDIGHPVGPKIADKCYIVVDGSDASPFKNTIYAIWISSEPTRTVVLTSYRRPGQSNFSDPVAISHSGEMLGPSLAVGPNGEFYAAWQGIGSPRVILFNESTDGGQTFFPPIIAHPDYNVYNYVGSLSSAFDPAININGVRRMNSFPVIDVDRSNGPNRGMIYIAWAETINGADADVFVQKLTPQVGAAPFRSNRIKVNNDQTGADQFLPWLSVDPSSGAVEVAFYDRRDDPGNLFMNAYLARSTDGGATFSDNIKLSSMSSNPLVQSAIEGSFGNAIGIGDYIGIAALNGTAHVLWPDTRAGSQQIYYGSVQFEPSGGGGGGGGGGGMSPPNDGCQTPRIMGTAPSTDTLDTTLATSAGDDPQSCSGGADTNSVWYSVTPTTNTVIGLDTAASSYDTVLSVYSGSCGALTRIACNDNFAGTRSVLTFTATAGTTYLIEASGKGSGGTLVLRSGYPTVTGVEYTTGPDDSPALHLTGSGFINGDATVTVQKDGDDTVLPTNSFLGTQSDGTATQMFSTKKKLKKLVKKGQTVIVTVESPAGSGRKSIPFAFTR